MKKGSGCFLKWSAVVGAMLASGQMNCFGVCFGVSQRF